ncbi:putative lipid-binding protein AIR1 [Brachypodium distachyon]|uniref:Hydrophobic seed protein domain-containing protein n=1 Tax=Brachypodium distachyon TaxID=15368 RepID=A0A0Q3IBW2_BRADI|nr:putative lipid-binding protein AIR1 [Brachypodium distachyon]KQJ97739.1 hypothetical protein BRADI_3g32950v3 [Brachypodium distachyon]|eukprot:XP_014756205.1 putative lipid-binding protein AIR1 [Brachypodium distachyon]
MAMAPRAVLLLAVSLLAMASAASALTCPKDGLKLKACVDVLGALKLRVNVPQDKACCSLLDGLAGVDAALCLCSRLTADVLGGLGLGLVNLDLPVNLRLLLNNCGMKCPDNFRCPHRH